MANEELLHNCRQVVGEVLVKRGWKLVEDEEVFVVDVWQELQRRLQLILPAAQRRRPLVKVIEDATIRCYNRLWHAACGEPETLRQQQAFTELHQYLFPIAYLQANHNQYIAEESTQKALMIVCEKLKQVRNSGNFASWAGRIVSREVIRTAQQAQKGKEISESDLLRPDQSAENRLERKSSAMTPPDALSSDPEHVRSRVESLIRTCLRRSQRRQEGIIRRFLEEKEVKQVANELGITDKKVHGLTYKARETLRKCKQFLSQMEKWFGEIPSFVRKKRGEA